MYVISKLASPSGKGVVFEDKHRVKKFRRLLEPDPAANRAETLVQFWAVRGGLRTIKKNDIVDVS